MNIENLPLIKANIPALDRKYFLRTENGIKGEPVSMFFPNAQRNPGKEVGNHQESRTFFCILLTAPTDWPLRAIAVYRVLEHSDERSALLTRHSGVMVGKYC